MIEKHVLAENKSGLGHIVLNRPEALNALSLEMIDDMRQAVQVFGADQDIKAIIVSSTSEKAFCTGGDVKAVALDAKRLDEGEGKGELCREIFRREYLLNTEIHESSIPYVSVIDGMCMGGGLGISLHGSHSIVTEKTVFAMPEVFIGFFPDVGSSYIFNRLEPAIGRWLLMTGARLNGAEMVDLGLATHYLESRGAEAWLKSLFSTRWDRSSAAGVLNAQLSSYGGRPPAVSEEFKEKLQTARTVFKSASLPDILKAAEQARGPYADDIRDALKRAAPLSLQMTLSHLTWARDKDFHAIMNHEYRLSQYFISEPDFYEGVRSVLIDKDRYPQWQLKLSDMTPAFYHEIEDKFSDLRLY